MKKKRLLCLLLALCALLSLLGCSGGDADADSNQIYNELADYSSKRRRKRTFPSPLSPCRICKV